jgi:hypothetical protein
LKCLGVSEPEFYMCMCATIIEIFYEKDGRGAELKIIKTGITISDLIYFINHKHITVECYVNCHEQWFKIRKWDENKLIFIKAE